jgi:phosphoribosyl 1,2-cyclic phosphodiesterase
LPSFQATILNSNGEITVTPMAGPTPSRREGGSAATVSVRFWGVRGAIPCPGAQTLTYGGNTACVEVRCGDKLLILDGGSGLRPLGDALNQGGGAIDADILFSHFHIDHVIGLPFFRPAYEAANRFRLWGARLPGDSSLSDAVAKLMSPPLFPVGVEALAAKLEFREFTCGETLRPHPGITVRTASLNHPGGANGYRIEFGGKAIAYITDTEHPPAGRDANVLALVERADLMIYDANYTDAEYPGRVGWGHSTWQEGVRLADAARAKTLALFHHDPAHDDKRMDALAAEAAAARPGTIVAKEGAGLRL